MDYKLENLTYGTMRIFTKGDETLYAYETKDPITDQVILLKKGDSIVSIEAPLFKNNVKELNEYVRGLGVKNIYILLVDHVAPISYLPEGKLFSTKEAISALRAGGPKGLFDNFVAAFGADNIENALRDDYQEIGNDIEFDTIKLSILPKGEEFDVVIPSFNAVYTHMLGHDVHSIIAGKGHAEFFIKELEGFIENGYEIILTSHYIPETIEDVKTKIAYVKDIVYLASISENKEDFIAKAKAKYPEYSGLNYLDISANAFFA